jgi:ABC-type multidrug transport system ATPase subunit
MTELLRAEHAGKTYGKLTALRDVSVAIDQDRPSILAVVGESGSGKTTLARMLLGLVAPTTGRVLYHGDDLHRLGSEARMAFAGTCRRSSRIPMKSTIRSIALITC